MNKILSDNSKFENLGPVDDPKNVNFFIKKEESFINSLYYLKKSVKSNKNFIKRFVALEPNLLKCMGWLKFTKTLVNHLIDQFCLWWDILNLTLPSNLTNCLSLLYQPNILLKILFSLLTNSIRPNSKSDNLYFASIDVKSPCK